MHVRRAPTVSAPPLNCGVRRRVERYANPKPSASCKPANLDRARRTCSTSASRICAAISRVRGWGCHGRCASHVHLQRDRTSRARSGGVRWAAPQRVSRLGDFVELLPLSRRAADRVRCLMSGREHRRLGLRSWQIANLARALCQPPNKQLQRTVTRRRFTRGRAAAQLRR
jgi:hypothetical protein